MQNNDTQLPGLLWSSLKSKISSVSYKYIYALLIVLSFFIGFVFKGIITKHDDINKDWRITGKYHFISPLLECSDTLDSSVTPNKIKHEIEDYIKQQKTNNVVTDIAVYYRDLKNGPWFGIQEDMKFSPSSLMKVPLMIALFSIADDNPQYLTTKLVLKDDVNARIQQNITDGENLDTKSEYTVKELIEKMIIDSDNVAANTLYSFIDKDKLNSVYTDLGIDMSKSAINPTGNTIDIKDYSSFFRILYNSSYLEKDDSEEALSILSKSTFKDGIVKGVPENITVAHKFGERVFTDTGERQLHDCGIVYAPKSPYLICIMTRGHDFPDLYNVVGSISKIVYTYVSTN